MEPAGWTFQEQILSTRLVRYSDDEARWMYGSRHAYECGTVTDDHPRRQSLTTVRQLDTPRKVYSYWTNLVSQYLARALTVEKDRLPAQCGIAPR